MDDANSSPPVLRLGRRFFTVAFGALIFALSSLVYWDLTRDVRYSFAWVQTMQNAPGFWFDGRLIYFDLEGRAHKVRTVELEHAASMRHPVCVKHQRYFLKRYERYQIVEPELCRRARATGQGDAP